MTDIPEFPPNYDDIVRAFPAVALMKPVFSWGEDLYNPYRLRIDKHLRNHEALHASRQWVEGVWPWWNRYLDDPEFRLQEETLAYQAQLRSFARWDRSRERRHNYALQLAGALSGPVYGNLLTRIEAYRRITG